MSKLLKQSVLYAIGEIVPKLVSFFLLPVYTHYLSKTDYGIISYTNSFVMFLFVLCVLSLNTYVLRFYFEKEDETYRRRLLGNFYIIIAGINLLLSLLAYLLLPIVIEKYHIQVPWEPYFKLAVIANFLEVFSVIPLVLYRVKQQAKWFTILSLSRTLLQMLLIFLLIVVFKWGILGHFYGRLFSLVPFFFIYWGIIARNATFNINFKELKKGLAFSTPLLPGALAYLALSLSDRIILERFVPISQIGIYSLAYTLALTLNIVIQGFYKAVEPEIFQHYGKDSFNTFIKKTQNTFFLIVYFGAMFITLFSQEVFKIMASKEFYEGYLLVPILMIGVIMTGQNVIFGGIIIAEKKNKVMGVATIVGAIISVVFNLSLMKYGGVYIAAISSAVSFAVMNTILYKRMSYSEKSLKAPLLALLLFVLISFGLFYIVKISFSWEALFIKVLLLSLYFILLLKVFKVPMRNLVTIIRKK
ncbi:lipopolysaccharide biosynthesis protein [Capnocytophaga leadbetteri]|uniref:lipopolysaccharide biosynthesis protein n=1 Tax=Capnocytophaga leadbetteri TaxID=327575 RepID=UPI0028F05677|nr:oligosaccharide flippase family protein [Capnocytophaga leadbetteri]